MQPNPSRLALTVAMMMTPALSSAVLPLSRFSSSMKGMRWPTARFITRADLMTWTGRKGGQQKGDEMAIDQAGSGKLAGHESGRKHSTSAAMTSEHKAGSQHLRIKQE